jgi:hypothetical protein
MRWMTMREFLRGGYQDLDEMTVVASHGRPVFVVSPVTAGRMPPVEDAPSTGDESVLRSRSGGGTPVPPRSAGVPEA